MHASSWSAVQQVGRHAHTHSSRMPSCVQIDNSHLAPMDASMLIVVLMWTLVEQSSVREVIRVAAGVSGRWRGRGNPIGRHLHTFILVHDVSLALVTHKQSPRASH